MHGSLGYLELFAVRGVVAANCGSVGIQYAGLGLKGRGGREEVAGVEGGRKRRKGGGRGGGGRKEVEGGRGGEEGRGESTEGWIMGKINPWLHPIWPTSSLSNPTKTLLSSTWTPGKSSRSSKMQIRLSMQ